MEAFDEVGKAVQNEIADEALIYSVAEERRTSLQPRVIFWPIS